MKSGKWEVLVIKAIPTFTEYQTNKLCEEASAFLKLNSEISDTTPMCCPICKQRDSGFMKKGFSGRKQRYQCKCCGKKFTYDVEQLTAHSHQTKEKWNIVLRDTLELVPLDKTAAKISVTHTTAFNMRHKILHFLEKLMDEELPLGNLVEADETFVLESEKGTKHPTRNPRKHGSKATSRGLSHEQYCVCFATDRNHKVVAKCVNRAKPSCDDTEAAIGQHIADGTAVLCGGTDAYNKMIENKHCKKIELAGHESYDKVYHLNTVNALHRGFKEMLLYLRGISCKYLNRYAALFCINSEYSELSTEELVDLLRQKIKHTISNATLRGSIFG